MFVTQFIFVGGDPNTTLVKMTDIINVSIVRPMSAKTNTVKRAHIRRAV